MHWLFTVANVLLGLQLAGDFQYLSLTAFSLTTAEVPRNGPWSPPALESGKYSMALPCPPLLALLCIIPAGQEGGSIPGASMSS